jgi:hypothetical protein
MVNMAVHKLCSSARIKLVLVKMRIPLGFSNGPPDNRALLCCVQAESG